MKETRGYLKAFTREKRVLQIFGIYPLIDSDIKLSFLRLTICCSASSIQLFLMMMLLLHNDISNFLDGCHFIIVAVILLCKIPFIRNAKMVMTDIEDRLKIFDSADIPHGILDHVKRTAFIRDRIYLPQWIMVVSGILAVLVLSLVLHKQRILLLNSWFPFDLQSALYYYPTLFFQLMVLINNAVPNLTIDTMYSILVDIACCELDVLAYKLSNLDPLKNPDDTIRELKENVICHQNILNYVTLFQKNIYTKLLFPQCIGSVTVICVLGFQLTMSGSSFLLLEHGCYAASMIFQIFFYTWFGQKFTEKSYGITQACYMSRWYECDIRIQKTLLNIMTRSKNPFILNAYIFDLTLETFLGILKSAYSYMAVLRTMYGE